MARKRPAASSKPKAKKAPARRPMRTRPTPKWLSKSNDLDEMARRRCLLVLSVLAGERPVSEVIEEMQISRGFYYQLETKALNAMLLALAPGGDGSSDSSATTPAKRIEELEAELKKAVQEKRRAEHMLSLTRQLLRPGPVKSAAGRPRKTPSESTTAGRRPSRGSPPPTKAAPAPAPAKAPVATTAAPAAASTPTPAGPTTPSAGPASS